MYDLSAKMKIQGFLVLLSTMPARAGGELDIGSENRRPDDQQTHACSYFLAVRVVDNIRRPINTQHPISNTLLR
jgi:hypothetical protein